MQVNVLGRSIFLPRVKGKLPRPKPREFEDAYFFFLPFLVNFFRTCLATFLATFSATFLATLAGSTGFFTASGFTGSVTLAGVAGLAAARDAVVRAGVARGARTAGLAAAGVFGVAGCAAKDSLVMV
mgnify:FL=1